jgi:hypothetical protein
VLFPFEGSKFEVKCFYLCKILTNSFLPLAGL